jgi:hypothetical protein
MHVLKIKKPTVAQLKKLLAGKEVRLVKGRGFQLIVHPGNFDIASNSFNRGMPSVLQLSPAEIELNTAPSPEEHQETAGKIPVKAVGTGIGKFAGYSGLKAPRIPSVSDMFRHTMEMEALGEHTGHKYGVLHRAALGNFYANEASSKMAGTMERAERDTPVLMRGRGMEGGVGGGGNLLTHSRPQALRSQPYSASFQLQHTMPPQFQRLHNSV